MDDIDLTLKRLYATKDGKEFIDWLIDRSGVYRSSFTGDPIQTVYNDGYKGLALLVISMLGKEHSELTEEQVSRRKNLWTKLHNSSRA